MGLCFDGIVKEILDGRVRGDVESGYNFLGKNFTQREGLSNPPDQLDPLAHRHKVGPVGEVLRIDDGVVERIARVDVDATLAKWMLEGHLDGDSLLFGGGHTSGPQ